VSFVAYVVAVLLGGFLLTLPACRQPGRPPVSFVDGAFTATSANGLAYMCEQIHWAAGARLPIVMGCVNRAMAAPHHAAPTTMKACSDWVAKHPAPRHKKNPP
jgi:hypothetical protein